MLSIAVVHHFATTERRVHALKELARVLRIGGRLVISVWAMEQKHRKVRKKHYSFSTFKNFVHSHFNSLNYILIVYSQFESQDVLIPWPKSYCMSAASDGSKYSDVSDSNEKRDDSVTQKYPSSFKR